MKTSKIFTILSLIVFSNTYTLLSAQEFQTLTYYEDDSLKLELDLFLPEAETNAVIPLVIYVHGGGFSTGNRTGGHNLGRFLKEQNVAVASISYTLYMKDKSFSCDGHLPEKIKAIQLAANQIWLSTEFFLKNHDKFTIDREKIFVAGSSAGAEAALHAAFWDREMMNLYENSLPEKFKYAGVISGAGAIMDLNLITAGSLVPVMMFHGDSDPTVPYATAAHHYCPTNASGWLMLFGSKSIYEHILSLDGAASLLTYVGGTHSAAGAHFYQNQKPVYDFIKQVIAGDVFQNQHFKF